ncbi:MAG: hypothetical protein EXR71_10525 [Myxococcales bacterium]|nr:hypothetical protein [Myxococcales bacterium]
MRGSVVSGLVLVGVVLAHEAFGGELLAARPRGGDRQGPRGATRVPVDDGPRGDAPVYFLVFSHHYHGRGGYYGTAAEVRTVLHAAQKAGQVKALTMFFDGILLERLEKEDPTLIPEVRAAGAAIGFHGEDAHGPYPIIGGGEEGGADGRSIVTPGMSFGEAVNQIQRRYSHRLDGVQIAADGYLRRHTPGTLNEGERGGVSKVLATFGDVQYMGGSGLSCPPASFALRGLAPGMRMWQGGGPFAWHYLSKADDPAVITAVETFLGKDTQAFWYLGVPALRQSANTSPPHWQGDGRRTKMAIEALPRRQPMVVSLNVTAEPDDLAAEYAFLTEYVARHPGSGFVNAATLLDKLRPPTLTLDPLAVAKEVAATWNDGPPDSLSVAGRPVALADALEVMARALVAGGNAPVDTTQVNGPVDTAAAVVHATGTVSRADAVEAARAMLAAADVSPYRAVPASLAAGSTRIGFHQAYRLFAAALLEPKASRLTVAVGQAWPPTVRAINREWPHAATPDVDAWRGAAFWTVRAAEWR